MGKEILVDSDIEHGRQLLGALTMAGVPVNSALWYRFPESDEWRLVIGSEIVERDGPIKSYMRVQSLLADLKPASNLTLSDIMLVPSTESVVEDLKRSAAPRRRSNARVLEAPELSGVLVPGAYIYYRW